MDEPTIVKADNLDIVLNTGPPESVLKVKSKGAILIAYQKERESSLWGCCDE
jgi:hypothetical protein